MSPVADIGFDGSVVVSCDGHLLVAGNGSLARLDASGRLLWKRQIDEICSAPLALKGGWAVVNGRRTSYLFSPSGVCSRTWHFPVPGLDDSGPSPTLAQGRILFSGIDGQIWVDEGDTVRELGAFGYDVLPPAVLANGDLAIAGYAFSGPTLCNQDGKVKWRRPDLQYSNSLVVVNRFGEIAYSDQNEKQTHVFDTFGNLVLRLPFAATLSEHIDGWLAVRRGSLALIARDGRELWQTPLDVFPKFGLEQAVSDSTGQTYVSCPGGVVRLDRGGEPTLHLGLGNARPTNLALGRDGVLFVLDGRLFRLS